MNEPTVKHLDNISEHIQEIIDDAYDLWADGDITRQDYINFLCLQAEMLIGEAEKHQAVLDSEIKTKLDTSS
jgi:hypothetical protein